ncbi:hypothetical protein QJS66_17020 [Kocuria rhizophila]|nr:hypothetical protein QJS66_17020 [Kocuria rhizophila]
MMLARGPPPCTVKDLGQHRCRIPPHLPPAPQAPGGRGGDHPGAGSGQRAGARRDRHPGGAALRSVPCRSRRR